MDSDSAGLRALEDIQRLSAAVQGVNVPSDKDINDFYLRLGDRAVGNWLEGLLT
jgi:hypothetical protein